MFAVARCMATCAREEAYTELFKLWYAIAEPKSDKPLDMLFHIHPVIQGLVVNAACLVIRHDREDPWTVTGIKTDVEAKKHHEMLLYHTDLILARTNPT